MSRAGPAPNRRVQAYAYTVVTTAVVLLFAVAEWLTERFLSDRSRAASTALELLIVLVATLVFRPIHRRTEALVETAFYRRRRQALESLAKFRRELHSFNDMAQLLRRVTEAVDHHFEAKASAIYLRRETFVAEASSFDVHVENVPLDDPLAIRFRSSATPAKPPLLKSHARGTHAFAMTVAGDLLGFLATQCPYDDYDPEELQMLAGLAQDLAAAAVALDPRLRRSRQRPANNIPADLPPLVGREREVAEIKIALAQSRLVTITGSGGVGKTAIALQCAVEAVDAHEHGAWFVSLAPISDPELVPGTVIASLQAGASDAEDDTGRLIEHLRTREALIVIDNCEQVLPAVSTLASRIRAQCPHVHILATSRELLHLDGEHVYRLQPLRSDAAAELFVQRAAAVSGAFDAKGHQASIRSICDHLDGIPLAIELAAARVRALSVDEILARLNERFRLLTGGAHTADPRQQTLARAIEWSYDLLNAEEQSLFLRVAAFRGSFSLAAAAAVCAKDGRCDEFHVLDVLTSLADKSLVTVTLGVTTRYRLLETIREFAAQKNVELAAVEIVARRHAAYFAQVAAQAYHEFDTRLPHGWLERLAPDIDNFRAALEFSLEGGGDRLEGAQLAADCGPVFMRLVLLREGLRWCEVARTVPEMRPATAGRIEYVASMMHNNLGENACALACAERATTLYQESSDERGLIRALSQVAQLYSRAHRYADAQAPAEEALRRARVLGEQRVLASVLRRCAYSLASEEIERARSLFAEALDVARACDDKEEVSLILGWWAVREAAAGCYDRAGELAEVSLRSAEGQAQMYLQAQIACYALASGKSAKAEQHAREALTLSLETQNALFCALAIAYCSAAHASQDAQQAAEIYGYAMAQLRRLEWIGEDDDRLAFHNITGIIQRALDGRDLGPLMDRGAALSQDAVLDMLQGELSTPPVVRTSGASRS
jgi:predicted ATPase